MSARINGLSTPTIAHDEGFAALDGMNTRYIRDKLDAFLASRGLQARPMRQIVADKFNAAKRRRQPKAGAAVPAVPNCPSAAPAGKRQRHPKKEAR